MGVAGQRISNPLTGERIVFVRTAADSDGQELVMESTWTRRGGRGAEHLHPNAEERIEVLSGTARYRVDGEDRELRAGDVLVVPAGTPHVGWNPTAAEVRLRMTFRPATRWEDFVERFFAMLAESDRSHRAEDYAALLEEFSEEIRMVEPAP